MNTEAISLTNRGALRRLGLWTLGVGIVLIPVGLWLWWPLAELGILCVILGVLWWLVSLRAGNDPLSAGSRRYMQSVIPAVIGYVIAIMVLGAFRHAELAPWVRVLIALLPVIPVGWAVLAMWRYVREGDELERRIQMEAVFSTCGVVGVAAFTLGMLKMAGVVHLADAVFWVLPAMFLVYGGAVWRARRKYGVEGGC
jgi:hypothetical protein